MVLKLGRVVDKVKHQKKKAARNPAAFLLLDGKWWLD
jgi:hypothetical protein